MGQEHKDPSILHGALVGVGSVWPTFGAFTLDVMSVLNENISDTLSGI
jgi:hypothetical protein